MRSPIEGENLSGYIREVLSSYDFNWYVKLAFVPGRLQPVAEWTKLWESIWQMTDPDRDEGWTRTPADAWDCFEQWLDEIRQPGPRGPAVGNYFWLEERRTDGQVVFHVLVAKWSGYSDVWEYRWKEISHGWAKTRELDDRTGGLISYLVMRAGCILGLNCGGVRGRYLAEDFRPWTTDHGRYG